MIVFTANRLFFKVSVIFFLRFFHLGLCYFHGWHHSGFRISRLDISVFSTLKTFSKVVCEKIIARGVKWLGRVWMGLEIYWSSGTGFPRKTSFQSLSWNLLRCVYQFPSYLYFSDSSSCTRFMMACSLNVCKLEMAYYKSFALAVSLSMTCLVCSMVPRARMIEFLARIMALFQRVSQAVIEPSFRLVEPKRLEVISVDNTSL